MANVANGRSKPAARWLQFMLLPVVLAWIAAAVAQPVPLPGAVFVTVVDGAIGVATTRQLARAIEHTQANKGAALVMRLDTPGGLVTSTRDLIKDIVASPVPIIVYVAPSGARAASAGTFIVYAAHVAAMAPGTNLGAATPVEIGGVPGVPQQPQRPDGEKDSKGGQQQTASQRKAINDVVALLRSLAQLRGRDVDFAEKAVREAATLTASEAKKQGVIDIEAQSVAELLAQVDGRSVKVAGSDVTLKTRNAQTVVIEPDWRTRALGVISNPNIAFLLLMLGFYGIVLEFWHPGSFVPGVIGGISLILALTALSALPVHYGALGLLVLGLALMIGEAFTPGIGALGIGGVAAFIVGSIFLFEGPGADIDISVSLPLILGMAATTAGLAFGILGAAIKARKRAPVTGAEEMIGIRGEVVEWSDGRGSIRVHGEIWSARGEEALHPRDAVHVVGRDGLTLVVERQPVIGPRAGDPYDPNERRF
jgi:membrane-bound serine protease (ClpP class)